MKSDDVLVKFCSGRGWLENGWSNVSVGKGADECRFHGDDVQW